MSTKESIKNKKGAYKILNLFKVGGDKSILSITLIIAVIGLIMVYSSSWPEGISKFGDGAYYFKRQFIYFIVGIFVMLAASNIDYRILKSDFMYLVFGVALILNIMVHFVGVEINGAKRWLDIGITTFMPSDILKFTSVIIFAKILNEKSKVKENFAKNIMLPFIMVAGLAVGVIVGIQSDLGTAGTLGITLFMMLGVSGIALIYPVSVGILGIVGAIAAIALEPYRIERFTTFLDPFKDKQGDGYQVVQSLYAIGSGGIFGAGLGQSKQKYYYIPFPYSDFIFSIFAEEFGFIGSIILICLYLALFVSGLRLSILSKNKFDCFLAFGLSSLIFVQTLVHIAVVTSSMPATGITMPLFSYGGTSLVMNFAAIGILLNISKRIKINKKVKKTKRKIYN